MTSFVGLVPSPSWFSWSLFLGWFLLPSMAADDVLELKREWYQRYPHYPDYCSTPEQMDQRAIPPLFGGQDAPSAVGDTKLVHVTAILRHGARTILDGPTGTTADGTSTATSNYQCWDGYWTSPETGIWDCGLKTLSMPPNPERIVEEEEGDTDPELQKIDQEMIPEAMLLFTKQYDALKAPQSNVLNGTCEQGQLILQGYEQQVKNGQALRDAYLYQEGKYSSTDSRMHLFQVGGGGRGGSNVLEPWADETQLYLRSDDAQATMTSGQLLMRGLFEAELIRSRNDKIQSVDSALNAKAFPTIPVHTADYSRDILGGFREHCKALGLLQAASDSSWEYQQFLRSDEAQEVQEFLGWHYVHDEQSILDCLMTTVCTDRPLPDRFGIYNPHPHSWFNRIAKYHVQNHSFHLNYNDAEYSKLSMGPLWAEIMDHIAPVLGDIMETQDRPRPPAKLAIYSGYDSTIMEILASLGAWKAEAWPPYASMVLLEIHELLEDTSGKSVYGSKYAFRLLYNGEILTDQVEGCTKGLELCDAQHLVNRVQPFAKRNVDCIDVNLEKRLIHPTEIAKFLLTTTGGIILILLIVGVSALIGSIAVFYHLTGSVPTNELKTLQRRVFQGNGASSQGGERGFTREDAEDLSDHRSSLALDEQAEMRMSDAAAMVDDVFEDEPQD